MSQQHLIEKIFEEMSTDGDADERQAERLVRLYQESSQKEKELIDQVMMCICGWTMKTLIEGVEK